MYAEVAVNRRVSSTFHYHIPPELADRLVPGHLVKVGFGTAYVAGIVVGLHETSPIPQTKPILERLDPLPVVNPAQLELARWLSRETLTPLGLCLWLMLPPGLTKSGDTQYTLRDPQAEGESVTQQRILSLLQRRGPLRGRQLNSALPRTRWQSAMSALVERGLVVREPVLDPSDLKPKVIRTVQLAIPARQIGAIAPRLGRESRRANVLEVLLIAPQGRMALSTLCLIVGCKPSVVDTLAQAGDVRLLPKMDWVELTALPDGERDERRPGEPFERAPGAKQVVEALRDARCALPAAELDQAAVQVLEQAGLVRRWTEPALVELMLSADQVRERMIELRGGQPYLDILTCLAQAGEGMALAALVAQTGANLAQLERLAEDGLIALGESEVWRDPLVNQEFVPVLAPPLTADQEQAWDQVRRYMDAVHWEGAHSVPGVSGVFLLYGVTGSGKTEIYLRAVERALAQGRQAVVMVPEISLTPQTVRRFAARFPGRVAIVHSGLSSGERYDTWRRARAGEIDIVVGTRSALFVPLPDIGLVILDEEHDDSYKQSPPAAAPYYHARETAIELMRITRGTVLLGSATPDVVTYFRAERGDYTLLRLPDRVLAHRERIAEQTRQLNAPAARYHPTDAADAVSVDLPPVHVVDMRQELKTGNRSIFSRTLSTALHEVLARDEQAILFLNRRGTATFVMCRDCGYIALCPRCDTPLTYHSPREALICHYCGYTQDHLTQCPDCGSHRIKHLGQGTELIEAAVKAEFPAARTIRWDHDMATGREAHELILRRFSGGQANILIGTQMIAKGLDLPQVTLVGIISADTALGLPDYRAGERTFQLLTQVAGRTGRGALGGYVVLQSYLPEHYAIRAATQHDYTAFYRQEIAYRSDQMYPPFRRLARIVFQFPTADQARLEAQRAAALLQQHITDGQFTATELIGPTPCFFVRRSDFFRWHLVLRSPDPAAVLDGIDLADGWALDIDPVDML